MHSKISRTLTTTGAALALVFSARGAVAQELPAARQIVDRYVEAVGGRAALARQNFRLVVAETVIPGTGSMTMETRSARPNKFAMRMTIPGAGLILGGFDGQVGWASNQMSGPQLLEGKELEQLKRTADMDAAVDLSKAFPTMETVERSTGLGRPCYRVRMVSAAADTAFACFDVESGLMSTMRGKQSTPMGEIESDIRFEDYKDFGGIKMPARTVTAMMGQEMVTTIKSVSTEPIPASEFELPADVRALVGQKPAAP